MTHRVLILGASYGSLLGTKLLMAGHEVCLVCTRPTAELITREGTRVRFPVGSAKQYVEVDSRRLPGTLSASAPDAVDPRAYDLVVLAMQEPQCASHGVRELIARVARSRKPCLAIMNMPPLPYLDRIPWLFTPSLRACYREPRVWDGFEPKLVTLASPDAQAFRPPEEPKNVLQVGLATNFKAAPFDDGATTALLRKLADDIEAARYVERGKPIEIPVKLKVHDSIFVPLAKWPMLIAGNYRCIRPDSAMSIRDAVHGDIGISRGIYDWVTALCIRLGAAPADLVPFEKYAKAAESLIKPSSVARAVTAGAEHIERVDMLVQRVGRQRALRLDTLHDIVRLVDDRLAANRAKNAAAQVLEAQADAETRIAEAGV